MNGDKKPQCWRDTDLLLLPLVSSSLAEMQSVFTVPYPAFPESGRKRITLWHWATTVVPAARGNHGSHFPVDFNFSHSPVLPIFPHNRVREGFLRRTVHQSWLPYNRWAADFEDRKGAFTQFSELLHVTVLPVLYQIWQLQGKIWTIGSADFLNFSEERRRT